MMDLLAAASSRSVAYTPFLHPLDIDRYWLGLLIPLALSISIVYKTIKLDEPSQLPRQITIMTAQIISFMVVAAAVLWLVSELM